MALRSRNMIDEDDPRVSQIGHPAPAWLVNYADLMTELVCFFVILYALSAALNKTLMKAKIDMIGLMSEENIKGSVQVSKDGMSITVEEQEGKVFFTSGQADLSPDMIAFLDKMAPTLKKLSEKHEIVIEGHTDDRPTRQGSPFTSNWELSTARGTNVVRYLVKSKKFDPRMISAVGYGEYRPLVPNTSDENRAKNRRVVFFIKNSPPAIPKADAAQAKKGGASHAKGQESVSEHSSSGESPPAASLEKAEGNEASSAESSPASEETPSDEKTPS